MDGGRAMLGAKGTGIGTAAKAAIDMGLARPMPSTWERRLGRELQRAYPGYAAARFFSSDERALAAAARAPGIAAANEGRARLRDIARREADGAAIGPGSADGAVLLLRPFSELLPGPRADAAAMAMPLLPCPSALAPSVLLVRDPELAKSVEGDILPPLTLASAHRALVELARMSEWYGEELWKKADRRLAPHFERLGPYLYPRSGGEAYDEVFKRALAAGALLSPDPELPSIVPGDFDDGELAALAAALAAT